MWLSFHHEMRVLFFMIGLSFRRLLQNKWMFWTNLFGMLANNLLFFIVWILIFRLVPDLRGWQLHDVALMYGLGATCFGLAGIIFGGFRQLAFDIETGRFDAHLCRPASSFTLALTSHFTHQAVGDALTGPVFWLLFCHLSLLQLISLSMMAILGSVIIAGIGMAIYSIAFWVNGTKHHAEIMLFWLISFLTTPLHGMPMWIKAIIFTVIPIGYVSYLPVEMIRDPSINKVIYMILGAIWAVMMARFVFYRGLRHYKGVSSLRTGV